MKRCAKCGQQNDPRYMFCLGCGANMAHAPSVQEQEPGGAPQARSGGGLGPRCVQCQSGRTLQALLGAPMTVRIVTGPGRQEDFPAGSAWVCVDCGHVAMFIPEDARRYLAGIVG